MKKILKARVKMHGGGWDFSHAFYICVCVRETLMTNTNKDVEVQLHGDTCSNPAGTNGVFYSQ